MATIPKTGISTGQAVQASQILNIIEALDGTNATDIVLDGIATLNSTTTFTGQVNIAPTQANTGTNVLTVDGSGRIYKTGSYSAGSSPVSGVTSFTNTNGTFISAGTENSSATGAVTIGTIDLSASGTKDINTVLRGDNTFGTPISSSFSISSSKAAFSDTATSSSHAENADTASYVENAQTATNATNATTAAEATEAIAAKSGSALETSINGKTSPGKAIALSMVFG